MYLIIETETTGLPKKLTAPITDINNWPRMIQIAWILCDAQGNKIDIQVHIIKPEGFTTTLKHQMSTE